MTQQECKQCGKKRENNEKKCKCGSIDFQDVVMGAAIASFFFN